MNHRNTRTSQSGLRRHALATAVVLALAGAAAHAQVSTATLKGQVSGSAAANQAGLTVTATNAATGNTYRSTTLAGGSYVLVGMAPGTYEIRVSGAAGVLKTETVTLKVGETAGLDVALGDAANDSLARVTVEGSANRLGVRDSQVGTNVSQRMINNLPQATHNFLSAADLAPGVEFGRDGNGNTNVQAGAQNFNNVNVFIDGIGQKNNILKGGVSGQDTSRGNPFPQSAIAEYKVLSQNYKAEFDQVSSVAITAVTKSGTNEVHAEAYGDRTGTKYRTLSPFEKQREADGVPLPPSTKSEYGFSVGGPIVKDQVHFFFAYDGKSIDDSRQVVPKNLDKLPATLGVVPSLIAAKGNQVDNFLEHLVFGKIDAQLGEEQHLSASVRVRRENDRVAESREVSAPGNDKARKNDETSLDLKHEWAGGPWLAESRAGYEDYTWNPKSNSTDPFVKYKYSSSTPPRLDGASDVLFVGGSPDAQKRGQKSLYVSEDLTYTGLIGHVLKGGIKLRDMKYDLSGTANSVDTTDVVIDTITGIPYYSGGKCTGTNIVNNGRQSDQCRINPAIPASAVNIKNKQLGFYLQDDWALTKQLELNVGVRYDYETNMLNNDYVTPADRVTALKALDGPRYDITPPAGQTYAQSLAKGGINIDDYISTGNSRKTFKGGFAPRVGASYDLFSNRETVLFGGWGRSFDRTMANHALDESQKNAQAGGEIWLIRNDFKMPYADQFSAGLRQGFGEWNSSITLSRIDAKNQFIWFGGNRDANGGWAKQSPIDPLWGGPNGFGTLILGDFVGHTKTDAVLISLEKPYTQASGWAVNVAYTYSKAETTSKEWNNDIFDWTYGRPGVRGFHPSTLVDKHRVVVAGLTDKLLPWGINLSGKLVFASGKPRRITNCSAGFDKCVSVEGDAPRFAQFDMGVGKDFSVYGYTFGIHADVLNLFNTINYGGFDDWGGGPVAAGGAKNQYGGDNLNVGTPNASRGDPRTVRIAANIKF